METQIEELTPEQTVQNGATWLDENRPGWADRIDLSTLAMWDAHNCIAGQEFRDDAASMNDPAINNGYTFLWSIYGATWLIDNGFVTTRDYWEEAILERRAA